MMKKIIILIISILLINIIYYSSTSISIVNKIAKDISLEIENNTGSTINKKLINNKILYYSYINKNITIELNKKINNLKSKYENNIYLENLSDYLKIINKKDIIKINDNLNTQSIIKILLPTNYKQEFSINYDYSIPKKIYIPELVTNSNDNKYEFHNRFRIYNKSSCYELPGENPCYMYERIKNEKIFYNYQKLNNNYNFYIIENKKGYEELVVNFINGNDNYIIESNYYKDNNEISSGMYYFKAIIEALNINK